MRGRISTLAAALAMVGAFFLGFDPVPAAAAIASTQISTVTTDIGTYQTMVSTVMAAVLLVVLVRVGWGLMRKLVKGFQS